MSLSIRNLTKSYGDKILFDRFSYDFRDTGLYVIVGESGRGKTTLLRMISGLDKDFSGEILGGGFESCSVAFQEYRLFENLTAIENVKAAVCDKNDDATDKRAYKLLNSLGFSDEDMKKYPAELSGGMKQRVSIARAVLKNSSILLLDEPTKELDRENAERLLSVIIDEAKRRTVLLVTHDSLALGLDEKTVISI